MKYMLPEDATEVLDGATIVRAETLMSKRGVKWFRMLVEKDGQRIVYEFNAPNADYWPDALEV
jgi:hypothetical protein